jgi:ribosome-binding protein aMBF1 (putative translation factor)
MAGVQAVEGRVTSSVASSSSAQTSRPALPPDSTGLRPVCLPPETDRIGSASTHDITSAQAPAEPVNPDVLSSGDLKATTNHEATSQLVKSPRRYLDPELAQAIKEAKLKTGASWRKVARYTGLSHSYLVQLSNGQRVPSRATVEVLADVLPIQEWAVKRLLEAVDTPCR